MTDYGKQIATFGTNLTKLAEDADKAVAKLDELTFTDVRGFDWKVKKSLTGWRVRLTVTVDDSTFIEWSFKPHEEPDAVTAFNVLWEEVGKREYDIKNQTRKELLGEHNDLWKELTETA